MATNGEAKPGWSNQPVYIDQQTQQNIFKQNKMNSKKFFKSKIDFTAPIKHLQYKQNVNRNIIQSHLSDDNSEQYPVDDQEVHQNVQ